MRASRAVLAIVTAGTCAMATSLAIVGAPAQAASLVGKPCTKLGATQGDGPGRTIICTKMTKGKNKGKLIWQLQRNPGPGPGPGPGPSPSGGIPAVIESWGISVAPYDAATKKAGEMYVGSIPFPPGSTMTAPIQYYGEGPRRPTDPPDYVDPQMTFFVPLGTTVQAIVSGEVCAVTKLVNSYSDDYSIGIGIAVGGQPACVQGPDGRGFGRIATWEHEHVMEPKVKVGDLVKAGEPIAVASYYKKDNWLYTSGYALYEIGILAASPDGRPMHVCPALYLKPAVKGRLLDELATAARAYEANTGTTHYAAKTLETGCITDKPSYA
jgi:hypothetical protein